MTDKEINAELRKKWPSCSPRAKHKSRLKMRFGNRLDAELAKTMEKLMLLCELRCEKMQGKATK